ncbi:MAG: GGDEF domain-containing protein [Lachnospiraceae bacterium]|nr:GGDEF domain-containing protein [Lachnospiraceae bacterium]
MGQDTLKSYKIYKIVQLVILIIFAVAFFCYLHFDPLLKNNLYSNKNLLTICIFLWAFMIYSAISLFFDFTQLERNIVDVHALNETAFLDKLTRLPNRNTVDLLIDNYGERDISNTGGALITITNLPEINEKRGRKEGDNFLRKFASAFEKVGDRYGFAGRNSGNEFIVIIDDCTVDKMQNFVNDLSHEIQTEFSAVTPDDIPIRISFQYALNSEEKVTSVSELLSRIYQNAEKG